MCKWIIPAATALLGSCQTVEAATTASSNPEETIKAPTAAIKAGLLSLATDQRFNFTRNTEDPLQIDKPSDNFGAAPLSGSKYYAIPAERIVFTIAPLSDATRVVASSMFVTNPSSTLECITPINTSGGINRTRTTLTELKIGMDTQPLTLPTSGSAKKKTKSS